MTFYMMELIECIWLVKTVFSYACMFCLAGFLFKCMTKYSVPFVKLRSHYQPILNRVIAQGKLSRDVDRTSSGEFWLDVIKMSLHVTHYRLILS